MKTDFPYDGWVLSPSMRPHKVTVAGRLTYSREHVELADGRTFKASAVHVSEAAAINAGHATLDANQASIDKKQKALDKRRVNLDKAHARHVAVKS